MKIFELKLIVNANDNLTESELLKRLWDWRDPNRQVFRGDCVLSEIRVNELNNSTEGLNIK
jgi:hypothetical protein